MKLFRRETSEDRSIDRGRDEPQASVVDLTGIDAVFDLTEVNSILGERSSDIDRIEGRIEALREQGEQLSNFDPAKGTGRKGSVETLDLRELMVSTDDEEGLDRWFDVAFADEGSDTTARNWQENS